jgi:hypothetical protein
VDKKVDFENVSFIEVPPTTTCKHGTGACEKCGTTNERDHVHTTRSGKGAVARLQGR